MRRAHVLLALAACSHRSDEPPAAPAVDSVAAWRDDLKTLTTTIATRHKNAFFHTSERDWRATVADLDAKLPQLDDAHVATGFARVVASLGDAHTLIGVVGHSGWYPLAFIWFDDGIFVAGASESWAIGKKLVAIGGHPIDQVIAAMTPLISQENVAGIHDRLPDMLLDPALLAGTELAPADHASYSLAAADGSIRELDVVPGKSGASLAPPKILPVHLTGPATSYWNKYLAPEKLLYFAYNACAEDPKVGPFATFVESTLAFADQHPVDRFVIDLRSNEGGNSLLVQLLLDGIAARPALAGRVFVIIGMHTFSSGMLAAMDAKRRLHATLVGGPTSGKPSSYGEIVLFTLPHSKIKVQYSTKLFDNPDFPGDSVTPDLPVVVKADDWFSGRDPAMDAIAAAPVPAR